MTKKEKNLNKLENTNNTLSDKELDDIIRSQNVRKNLRARIVSKWVAIFCIIALLLTGGAWGVLNFIEYNNLKIVIQDKYGNLSISEKPDFSDPSSFLIMKGPGSFTNITYTHIALDEDVLKLAGNISQGAYIAYSFFLRNTSKDTPCEYFNSITLSRWHNNMDAALRVMMIKQSNNGEDREISVYAKERPDNNQPEAICYDIDDLVLQKPIPQPEIIKKWGGIIQENTTKKFIGIQQVDSENVYYIDSIKDQKLNPMETVKYTYFIWIEGSDAQCKDDILNGYCTVSIQYAVQSLGSKVDINQ